jgi:hypothetical protein
MLSGPEFKIISKLKNAREEKMNCNDTICYWPFISCKRILAKDSIQSVWGRTNLTKYPIKSKIIHIKRLPEPKILVKKKREWKSQLR